MKVLFLDIDGVMNNESLLIREGIDAIGEEQLDLLKSIVFATGAKIILSSTWRLTKENRQLVHYALRSRDMDFIGRTVKITGKFSEYIPRCREIQEWLDRFPDVEKFAILDDDIDAGDEGLGHSYFQTEFVTGLTAEVAAKVIEHLGVCHDRSDAPEQWETQEVL